jgi:hypothetical protein
MTPEVYEMGSSFFLDHFARQESVRYNKNIIGAYVGTNSSTKLLQFRLKGKWQSFSARFLREDGND